MQTSNPQESAQEKIQQLQFREQIEEFNRNLQKGDLGLSQPIDNGFVLYGNTRAGKTALGHILTGNSLKGCKINGQLMVQATTSRNNKAKIGNTMNSQTLVPNVFQIKLKGKSQQYYVIDTPGYGDTNGMLTILANGYYHYRLYSKVKNMKFILCFDAIQLQGACVQFLKTIIQWTSSFKDYLLVRKQIWKSVAFIITKVQDKATIKEDLIVKLKTIVRDMRTLHDHNVKDAVKQIIEFVIEDDRLFYIKKIKEGQTIVAGDLLQKIDKKVCNWWSRDYDEKKKQVDMEPVAFALSQEIIKSTTEFPTCRKQFIELIDYYNIRIKEFLQPVGASMDVKSHSLSLVIQELIDDAMGHPDSHKFLDIMQGYIDIHYKKYDESYNQERERLQKQLFAIETDEQLTQRSRSKFRGKDKNYLVKKFKCLRQIEILKNQISYTNSDQRDIKQIQACAANLYEIIREFNHIAFKRDLASKVIQKYGYIIHRIIEEAKIFILLIDIHGIKDKQKIKEQSNGKRFELVQVLKDCMGIPFKYNKQGISYEDLHLAFIKNFDLDDKNYESLLINESLVSFFTQVDIVGEEDVEKQFQVVLRYSDQVLQEADKLSTITFDKQKGKLIRRLTNIRTNCEASFELEKKHHKKDVCMFTIRKASKNLAKLLELLGQYELSRKVYTSIRFVDSVCKLYRNEIDALKKGNVKNSESRNKSFQLRIKFSEYLSEHFRQNEAIEVLQESFQLAEDMNQLKLVKQKLSDLKLRLKDVNFTCNYEKNLFQEEYFENFSTQLEDELKSFSQNAV